MALPGQRDRMAAEQVEAVRAATMYREAYAFRITIVGILLADILLAIVDPRIRGSV